MAASTHTNQAYLPLVNRLKSNTDWLKSVLKNMPDNCRPMYEEIMSAEIASNESGN